MPDAPEVLARTKDVDPGALHQAATDANALRSAARELEQIASEVGHTGSDIGIEGRSADAAWPQFDGLRRTIVSTADDLAAIATAAVTARDALAAAQVAYDQLPPGDIPTWQKAALIGGGTVLGPAGPIAGAVLADRLGDEQAEKRRLAAESALDRLQATMQRQTTALPDGTALRDGGMTVVPEPGAGSAAPADPLATYAASGGGHRGGGGGIGWEPSSTAVATGFDPVRGTGSAPSTIVPATAAPGGDPTTWTDGGGANGPTPGSGSGSGDGSGTGPAGTGSAGLPGWSPGSADGRVDGTTGSIADPARGAGGGGWTSTGPSGASGAGGMGGALAGGLAVGGAALGSAGLRGAGRNAGSAAPGLLGTGPGAAESGRTSGLGGAATTGPGATAAGARVPVGGGTAGPSGLGIIHPAPATGAGAGSGQGAAAGGRGGAPSALRGSALSQDGVLARSEGGGRGSSPAGGSAMVPPSSGAQRGDASRRRRPTDGLVLPDVELDEETARPSRSRAQRAGRRGAGAVVVGNEDVADDDAW